jgi:Ca2+-binding RTX toxin-like protein
MATQYFTTDVVGDRIILDKNTNDHNVVVATGVTIGSEVNDAFILKASFHDVLVRGTVSGYGNAIRLGDTAAADSRNTLHVASDGFVHGQLTGAAFTGTGSVANHGTILGNDYGVTFATTGNLYNVAIANSGLISGGKDGVWIHGDRLARLTNTGTIEGVEHSYRGFANEDQVVNRGVMLGDVELHGGRDLYDGRGGRVEGNISGGDGNDTFRPGAAEESIYGDGGFDTLDFRTTSGVRVELDRAQGTGVAAGDFYFGIEWVQGSNTGADTLVGNSGANVLTGNGGADSLQGRDGADRLDGGTEADRLSGGLGNDVFVFDSAEDGGDLITDWRNVSGDNDRIQVRHSAFGVEDQGTLLASRFQSRADNLAQDGDDRFVFRTTDATLWWDADGKGRAGPVLLADLQAGAVITLSDFVVV